LVKELRRSSTALHVNIKTIYCTASRAHLRLAELHVPYVLSSS